MQNKSLRLTPNYATPVIMGIESTADSNIGGYYKLYKKLPDGTPLLITDAGISGTKADINSFWTGIASSMACRDFKSDPLFYNLSDRNAFSFAEICDDRNGSRGFRWVNIPATNRSGKKLFLQTIFYTPAKESYSIKRACAERTIFASPTTVVPVNEDREIQLNYSKPSDAVMEGASWMPSIQSLFEMVSDAGGRKVCISTTTTPDGNAVKAELWWNPQAMARALEENKQRMVPADSGWNCPIEGTIALGVSE
jgi:hypothetical protein